MSTEINGKNLGREKRRAQVWCFGLESLGTAKKESEKCPHPLVYIQQQSVPIPMPVYTHARTHTYIYMKKI